MSKAFGLKNFSCCSHVVASVEVGCISKGFLFTFSIGPAIFLVPLVNASCVLILLVRLSNIAFVFSFSIAFKGLSSLLAVVIDFFPNFSIIIFNAALKPPPPDNGTRPPSLNCFFHFNPTFHLLPNFVSSTPVKTF